MPKSEYARKNETHKILKDHLILARRLDQVIINEPHPPKPHKNKQNKQKTKNKTKSKTREPAV